MEESLQVMSTGLCSLVMVYLEKKHIGEFLMPVDPDALRALRAEATAQEARIVTKAKAAGHAIAEPIDAKEMARIHVTAKWERWYQRDIKNEERAGEFATAIMMLLAVLAPEADLLEHDLVKVNLSKYRDGFFQNIEAAGDRPRDPHVLLSSYELRAGPLSRGAVLHGFFQ